MWFRAVFMTGALMILVGCATPADQRLVEDREPVSVSEEPLTPAPEAETELVPEPEQETKVVKAGEPVPPVTKAVPENIAPAAEIDVSSTHQEWEGEGTSDALIDGDLKTRWSSDYSEPQSVTLDFGSPERLELVRLHWEAAAARSYDVELSQDGQTWEQIRQATGKTNAPRVDTIAVNGRKARYLRLKLKERLSEGWGFSLYEIEVEPSN